MPTYQYEALNDAGSPQKGTITAQNSEEAIARIRGQGLFPTSVREQKVKKAKETKAKSGPKQKKKATEITINIGGVSKKQLTAFTRQFSTLQDAGLPILRSLQILEEQQKPGLLKQTIDKVTDDVSAGSSLSDAMAKHPKAFDRLYCKMVAAGELAGVLDMIMGRLADFLEAAEKLKRRIKGAMIYPAVVISVAVMIVTAIMIFIVPQFQAIFDDFDIELPALTLFLIDTASWIAGNQPGQLMPGWLWIILAPILAFFSLKLIRKTKVGVAVLDTAILKAPIFGGLVSKTVIARFTRTLGTLVRAGVPILDALLITRDTTPNYVYAKSLNKVHDSVRQGDSFAEPLRQAKVCDSIVVNMIDVGEETGDLDKMLLKIADNYDEEVDVMVGSLMSLLEPFMIIFLGGIVGFIVLALFLPLVKLIESISA